MELLTVNLAGPVRYQTHQGREYLIAPVTLIVPGVLNGSLGPLYYPASEVGKRPEVWNGIPVTIYHPTCGESAQSPAVADRQVVGSIYNASYVEDKLRGEAWIDIERIKSVHQSAYNLLANSESIEVSTGLATDQVEAEEGAVFNGPEGEVPYVATATNYRPDHLAILPDQVGACSLQDGCGINNALSHDAIREQINTVVRSEYGDNSWVEEVFPNSVVIATDEGLKKVKYTRSDKQVTLGDAPKKVRRVVSYTAINQGPSSGSTDTFTEESEMKPEERTELINELVTNSCCWSEDDRTELEGMTDIALNKTKESSDKEKEAEEMLKNAQQGASELEPQQPTDEEWLAAAPQSVKNTLAYADKIEQRERTKLVDRITVNVSDDAKPEKVAMLANKSVQELEEIASLMPAPPKPEPVQNFYGPEATEPKRVFNKDEDLLIPMEYDGTED